MEYMIHLFSWGSPMGLAAFFCLSGIGAGAFFWGLSRLVKSNKAPDESAK